MSLKQEEADQQEWNEWILFYINR